jgi:hypothetical protein
MSVGPIGLMVLWPLYALFYLGWLLLVGLYYFYYYLCVFLWRLVVVVAPLVWSLVLLGWAHIRTRTEASSG